jgi:hypothetical protein
MVIASLVTGCGGPESLLVAPTSGALEVHATLQGPMPDPNGFTLSLDGGAAVLVLANGSYLWADLPPGGHAVTLSGVANNCRVAGGSVRSVQVAAEETTQIWFDVTCPALVPASLLIEVSTRSVFGWKDPNGYEVVVDGVVSQRIGDAGSVMIRGIAEGEHSIWLDDIALGCTYRGGQTVVVPTTGTVTVTFTVGCLAPGVP